MARRPIGGTGATWAPRVRSHHPDLRDSLHAGKPWRCVEHIDEQEGTRGGRTWCLTLSCGHHAFRPIPRIAPDTFAVVFGKLVRAPRRVRCLFCDAGLPSDPAPEDGGG